MHWTQAITPEAKAEWARKVGRGIHLAALRRRRVQKAKRVGTTIIKGNPIAIALNNVNQQIIDLGKKREVLLQAQAVIEGKR